MKAKRLFTADSATKEYRNFNQTIKHLLLNGEIIAEITDCNGEICAKVTLLRVGNEEFYGIWEKEMHGERWSLHHIGECSEVQPKWDACIEFLNANGIAWRTEAA
jgi:hypothetical protein